MFPRWEEIWYDVLNWLRPIALRVLEKLSLKITSAPLRISPSFFPDFEYDLTVTRILLILVSMFQLFRRSSYFFFLCSSVYRFNLGWNDGDLHAHLLVPLPLLWNSVLFRVFNQPEKPFCYANIRRVERRLMNSMNSCQWALKLSDLLMGYGPKRNEEFGGINLFCQRLYPLIIT